MKRRLISLAVAFSFVLSGGMPVLVRAHEDGNESSSSTDEVKTYKKTQAEIDAYKQSLLDKAKVKVEELQEQKTARTKEVRQKACEAIKSAAENRHFNKGEYAAKHKAVFDKIFDRVDEFKEKKSLTVENGEALKAAANDASTTTQTEIDALTDLKPTIDCTDPDSVAAAIEAFKDQVTEVRNALKAYREAIRAYAQAIKSAAKATEGGTVQ